LSGGAGGGVPLLRLSGDSVCGPRNAIGEEQAIALLELIVSSVHRMIAARQ